MDPQTTLLVLLGLVTLGFFAFTYFAAKTWTITHVIMSVMVYFASVFFCWMAAAALKTHQAWRDNVRKFEEKIDAAHVAYELQKNGTATNAKGQMQDLLTVQDDTLKGRLSQADLLNKLEQQTADRGRVWRNCTPSGAAPGGGFTLTTGPSEAPPPAPMDPAAPAPGPESPAPATAATNHFQEKMVVYAFREAPYPPAPEPPLYLLPIAYLGEFKVKAATPTSVTLEPMSTEPTLRAQLNLPGTWCLYETMPGDTPKAFEEALTKDMTLAQAVDVLKKFMPKPAGANDAAYDKVINEYARDLMNVPPEPTDPPENVWITVKFVKPYKLKVDDEKVSKSIETYFEQSGLAVPSILKREGKSEIDVDIGSTADLVEPKARELINQGIATEVAPVFVRKLRDYYALFHQIELARKLNDDAKGVVTRDITIVTDSGTKLKQEVDYRTDEEKKLAADQARFEQEKKVVDAHLVKLMALRAKMSQERTASVDRVYRMGLKLATLQKEMADRIDEQTRQASAATPSTVPMTP